MKNWKALLAILIIAAGLTACSDKENTNSPTETSNPSQNQTNTPVDNNEDKNTEEPEETKYNGFVLNPDDLVLDEEKTELFINGENPTYDKENGCIVFVVPGLLEYALDDRAEVVITSDGDFSILDGTLVTDKYPALCTEDGYYGAAIQFDQELTPGNYGFSIKFSIYSIGFKYTVQ